MGPQCCEYPRMGESTRTGSTRSHEGGAQIGRRGHLRVLYDRVRRGPLRAEMDRVPLRTADNGNLWNPRTCPHHIPPGPL